MRSHATRILAISLTFLLPFLAFAETGTGSAEDTAETAPEETLAAAPEEPESDAVAEAADPAAAAIPALARVQQQPVPAPSPGPQEEEETMARVGPVTGFPIPRYVSLRASEANARRGPSRSHRIDWVFTRRAMPMMVVAEHGHWRRVIDRDGAGGWMHYSLLSGERTAIIEVDMLPLYARPDTTSAIRANAELGVTGHLDQCQPGWCLIEVGGYRGWVQADALWGVDPGESFD